MIFSKKSAPIWDHALERSKLGSETGTITVMPKANRHGSSPMCYKTLMVCCDLNAGNDNRLHITASLAERFDARVIGIAAESEVIPVNLAESDAFSKIACAYTRSPSWLLAALSSAQAILAGRANHLHTSTPKIGLDLLIEV